MCAVSGTSPLRMPQFIEAWDVDTIQDCNSSKWRFGPTPLHPKLSHGSHNPQSCVVHLAPSFVSLVAPPPKKKKIAATWSWGGTCTLRTRWRLSAIGLSIWSNKEGVWTRFRIGRTENEDSTGVDGAFALHVCLHGCVRARASLPPSSGACPYPREDWLPSKDNLSQTPHRRPSRLSPPCPLNPPQDPANHPILSEHPWHPLPLTLHTSLLPPLPPCRPPLLFGKTRKWETLCADSKMSRKSWVEAEIYVTGCILQTLSFENCPSNPHSCP